MEGKKKILLVSNGFYPEISPRSFRATELAKEFCRQGHEVTVLSKFRDFDYVEFIKEYPINFKMWNKPSFPVFPTSRVKVLAKISYVLSRLFSVLFEYPGIEEMFQVRKMLRKEKNYDLMISFAVPFPVHWGVAWGRTIKNKIASVWVADCGDPYMFAKLDTFKKPFYFKYLERNFCKKSDYITIPFEELERQFYSEFHSKIRVIPQGFNFDEIKLCQFKNSERPSFIFAGSVIPGKRDLDLLLDFLSDINWDFHFIVYTNQINYYNRFKDKLGDALEIKSYIDRLSLIYEMSKVNFLINVDTIHDSTNNIEAIPSKLIDYALSGRPILNINSAKLDEEKVLSFLGGDYSKRRVIKKDNFNIKSVVNSFLSLAESEKVKIFG